MRIQGGFSFLVFYSDCLGFSFVDFLYKEGLIGSYSFLESSGCFCVHSGVAVRGFWRFKYIRLCSRKRGNFPVKGAIAVFSTSRGFMLEAVARSLGVGGFLFCFIFI